MEFNNPFFQTLTRSCHILHWLEDVFRWNEINGQTGTP